MKNNLFLQVEGSSSQQLPPVGEIPAIYFRTMGCCTECARFRPVYIPSAIKRLVCRKCLRPRQEWREKLMTVLEIQVWQAEQKRIGKEAA